MSKREIGTDMQPWWPRTWFDEDIRTLRELWAAGDTTRKIAEVISSRTGRNFTRNAVIGQVHRLGLPPRTKNGRKAPNGAVRTPKRAAKKPEIPAAAPEAPVAEAVPLKIPFMRLSAKHCRAVLDESGQDGLAVFCGLPKVEGQAYCQRHASIYHAPRRTR